MGWQDRDYAREEAYYGRQARGTVLLRGSGLKLTTVLIGINIAMFVLDGMMQGRLRLWGAMNVELFLQGQVWRALVSQYLHGGIGHIFMNMLGLYFLGRYLEAEWGQLKFLVFYTACGLAGEPLFIFLVKSGWLQDGYSLGASGCILGVLGACAVLLPGIQLLVFFVPMSIRTAAGLFLALYIYNLATRGHNSGGDAAHLAGLVCGAGYAYYTRGRMPRAKGAGFSLGGRSPRRPPTAAQPPSPTTEREVDRILAKINEEGISSLSDREKQLLADASRQQRDAEQADDARFGRIDRL